MKKDKMLGLAISIASMAHVEQFDKGGKPYILHPLEVMRMVKSKESEVLQAAVLHDVLEDTDISLEILRDAGFSERVIAALDCLTHRDGEVYADYILRICDNRDAMLVKMADLKHNSDITRLKGVSEKDLLRMKKYHTAYILTKKRLKAL